MPRWKDEGKPTYVELSHENQRLRQEIETIRTEKERLTEDLGASKSAPIWPRRARSVEHDDEGLEERLWESLSAVSTTAGSSVSTWDDVVLPSTACSEQLIAYDKTWNSWVHYAVEYPRFQEECTTFIIAVGRGLALEKADPSWMAVYFSVLSVTTPYLLALRL